MEKGKMLEIVKKLPFNQMEIVYEQNGIKVGISRPSEVSPRFKNYDVKKNFQIWLLEGERQFKPNHLRVFIDLNLRVRVRPELKKRLLLAFDNIFYGKDPVKELKELEKEQYDYLAKILSKEEIEALKSEGIGNSLNDLTIIGVLAQLFIIEQEYGYYRESNYEPGTLFFQGWIRAFIDSPKEIDILCMSAGSRQPPLPKYTCKEDKKHKKYTKGLPPLWYLEGN